MSYCYTQNLGSIKKSHNEKLISSNYEIILPSNWRRTEESPLEVISRANDVVYKRIASATGFLHKVYLGTAQGEFKKRFYNHVFQKRVKKEWQHPSKIRLGLKT